MGGVCQRSALRVSLAHDCRNGIGQTDERYRQMTGEQRLAVALELHEMSCDIAREGIRRGHPTAAAEEVERLLRCRIKLARVK